MCLSFRLQFIAASEVSGPASTGTVLVFHYVPLQAFRASCRQPLNEMWRLGSAAGAWQATLIARFMGPTWGPSGADRTQVGPMLAPWTLLSGILSHTFHCFHCWMFLQKIPNCFFIVSIISQHWDGTYSWNISSYVTKIQLFYTVNTSVVQWCSNDTKGQGISSHGIDPVLLEYSCFSTSRVNTLGLDDAVNSVIIGLGNGLNCLTPSHYQN